MFRLSVALVALVSVIAAEAKASKRTYAVKGDFNPPPAWSKGRVADPNHVLRLRFGLPQGDFASLEEHLLQVSDPNHERYGAHLSKAEVEKLVAPKAGHVSSVEEWLAEHGFGPSDLERSPAGDWIIIAVPVSKAEELLDTTYNVWTHTDGTELVRTTTYSLPVDLHDAIEVVQPTNMFGRLRPNRATSFIEDYNPEPLASAASSFASGGSPAVDPSCNATITPTCLQQLYNTVGYTPSNKNNVLGIAGYLEQYANFQDLNDFYAKYYPKAVNSTLGVELISGGTNSQNISESGAEAALDVQYGGALTFPTKNIYYSTGGRPPFNPSASTPTNTNEPYADWVDYMLKKDHPPQTVTTSYGDDEVTVPRDYAERVCKSFAQLGARGVSLMFSSGDFGVGDGNPDPATAVCLSNDGKNTTMFLPIFPGGCPYVTTVGGTHFVPEVAVAFTGGGFSNYFQRPLYQELAVGAYVNKLGKTYKGLYNPNGRAYPDVAAQGSHYRIILSGKDVSIGGTSASSPTFASVISLVNDARLNAHLPPLGFLNLWLYTIGWAGLNDITAGNNPGCGTPGFNATVGWDPVTGLGTPNFEKLKKLAGVIF